MIKMRTRQIILALVTLLVPMGATAQSDIPDVSPTATYTDSEGNPADSNRENPLVDGQAPLFVNFYAIPTATQTITFKKNGSRDKRNGLFLTFVANFTY